MAISKVILVDSLHQPRDLLDMLKRWENLTHLNWPKI